MKPGDYVFAVPGQGSIIDMAREDNTHTMILNETLEQVQAREPGAVLVKWEDWRAEQAAKQDTPLTWSPSTEAKYMEMLEVLPPAFWEGGLFLVGEAYDHSFATGRPRFQAYRMRGGRGPYPALYEACDRPITVQEARALLTGHTLTPYRLPDGRIVDVDASAAKGAAEIDYTLAGGDIVKATRAR